ncbi:MAG: hypothetical protein J6T44_10415 [Prevotella sp.]|nr:hypothetical protein [Prevotella sp.]
MKKKLFFAALAIVAMVSCTSDENVTVITPPDPVTEETEPVISFNMGSRTATRADHFGKDAANLLNNKFIVSAFKGDGTVMSVTMPDYIVSYDENTAGKTESNTSDWEYVGTTAVAPSTIAGNKQTIKYWDYSTTQYDFVAYSTGNIPVDGILTSGTPSGANQILVSAIAPNSYGPTYTLQGDKEALAKCYIADMVTAYKDATIDPNHKYQDEVTLVFRNLSSKVRIALYETVPGYSVKDVKFYTDASTPVSTGPGDGATNATLFTTGSDGKDNFYTSGTFTVNFPTIGAANISETDYNKAHVTFAPVGTGKSTTQLYGTLNYTGKEASEADANDYLGRTLPNATYAGDANANYYTIVLPNEEGTVLELRIDYTLLATDGSGETITVHGATAFVPAIYAAWKPNYAYTYIFKISDNSNGWTDPAGVGPEGLFPITFDAVVVDSEEFTQSTITTVATPSITTYQKGHDVNKDEYEVNGEDIYIQLMKDGALLATNDANHPVQVWTVTGKDGATEADVMDALNIRVEYSNDATTGRNGVTLTKVDTETDFTVIPGVDGNDITITAGDAAKFTPESGKIYAVTYKGTDRTNTYFYSAKTYTDGDADFASGEWYTDPDGVNAFTGSFVAGTTYYKKYSNRNIDWAAKIIKVE